MAKKRLVLKQKGKGFKIFEGHIILIQNVRQAYSHLATPKAYKGNGDDTETNSKAVPKYSITVLMDPVKQKAAIDAVLGEIKALRTEVKNKVPSDRWCIKKLDAEEEDDSDDSGLEAKFPGWYKLNASEVRKPVCRDKDGEIVEGKDEIESLFYWGSRNDVLIRLWSQDNAWGKRMNAGLSAVRFWDDDEPLGNGGAPDDADAWDDIDESDEDEDDDDI